MSEAVEIRCDGPRNLIVRSQCLRTSDLDEFASEHEDEADFCPARFLWRLRPGQAWDFEMPPYRRLIVEEDGAPDTRVILESVRHALL